MNTMTAFLPVFGHFLIGLYFVFFGVWNIYHWRPTIDIMLQDHIPSPIFLMSIGTSCQIILGVMIMCNIYIRLAALLLIVFTVFSSLVFHPFWNYSGEKKKYQMSKFIDNLTITMGALILLICSLSVTPWFYSKSKFRVLFNWISIGLYCFIIWLNIVTCSKLCFKIKPTYSENFIIRGE